ncbi:MAG: threonine ammonia-lyase [Pyrinomonadaceae bacterium]
MTVNIADIRAAREVIKNVIYPTPILPDEKLSKEIGAAAFLKAESLQRSGSFKIRGAYNKISSLTDEEKSRGVITASAGNHAQGVAVAARLHDIKATIVLPEAAPLTKVAATKAQGAEVILKGGSFDEAVAFSKELAKERKMIYVHAFEDEKIIAGQGTIGLEISESLPDVSAVVVPIGGGGVCSGIAIAIKTLIPSAKVFGVQAASVPSVRESIKAGHPVEVTAQPTIADGIAVKRPGELTLPIIREFVDDVVEVTEDEIAQAVYHCVQNNRLVVEGAGAAGLAALLARKLPVGTDDKVCAVLCGGNIDANLLARILEQVLVWQGRYIFLRVLVLDRPGFLAGLLTHVAGAGANVIEVFHQRAMRLAPLGHVGIELLLEVRDERHGHEIFESLKQAGYHVEREGNFEWREG